jgi:hypothetical protein
LEAPRCRRGPPVPQAWAPVLPFGPLRSSRPPLARAQKANDQLQPVYLVPGVPVIEFRPRPLGFQAAVLVGVQQALEVEARRPLVLGLQDRLGIVQADPPDTLGERALGADQGFRGGTQPTVRLFYLLDERLVGRFPASSPPLLRRPSSRSKTLPSLEGYAPPDSGVPSHGAQNAPRASSSYPLSLAGYG